MLNILFILQLTYIMVLILKTLFLLSLFLFGFILTVVRENVAFGRLKGNR